MNVHTCKGKEILKGVTLQGQILNLVYLYQGISIQALLSSYQDVIGIKGLYLVVVIIIGQDFHMIHFQTIVGNFGNLQPMMARQVLETSLFSSNWWQSWEAGICEQWPMS